MMHNCAVGCRLVHGDISPLRLSGKYMCRQHDAVSCTTYLNAPDDAINSDCDTTQYQLIGSKQRSLCGTILVCGWFQWSRAYGALEEPADTEITQLRHKYLGFPFILNNRIKVYFNREVNMLF